MKIWVMVGKAGVGYILRAEVEEGDMVAEGFCDLRPGESLMGISYDEIVAHGSGVLEVDENRNSSWDKVD